VGACSLASVQSQTSGAGRPSPVPTLRYAAGSTIKVEQLIGDEDKERHQPILSRTQTRYEIEGTDLGYSFEHAGRAYFLFGDTVGRLGRALDTIAATDAPDPETPAPAGGDYLTIQPPGIAMGAFEVPVRRSSGQPLPPSRGSTARVRAEGHAAPAARSIRPRSRRRFR
jgi:hypothetical protein